MAFTPGAGAVISFRVDGVPEGQRQIAGLANSMGELSDVAKDSMKELAAFAGIGLSLGALTEKVIDAQREFDRLNASLVTATGATQSAAEAYKSLQSFAATTPYSVAEATEAFVKLNNMGLDPSEKALRSYGNTAAAMGKSLDQMIEAVTDASTGEFERLKEFGIKSQQTGDKVELTFKGVTRTIGNNADDIQAYLKKIGETDFAGAMAARAATLDGAISNLGDAWSAFLLKISQSGVGNAATAGITALSQNLETLAAAIATVAAVKLGSAIDGWVTKTYSQVAASAALRTATLAGLEADVASTEAKTAQLGATQAMIVVAREEAVSKLAGANATIASARAAITAAEAAGVQSFALRTVRLATAELQVAETQRAAMLAELAILGQQQASVSGQIAAATVAQTAAQNALNASTSAGAAASGLASRAIGMLGGPIGALITVLGIAATAWTWYRQKQDEATADSEKNVGVSTGQIISDLEKQNEKLRERIELTKKAGMADTANQSSPALERMAELLQKINNLKKRGEVAKLSPGDQVEIIDYQSEYDALERVVKANGDLKKTLDANGKAASDLLAVRQRLSGVNQQYLDDLQKLETAYDKGAISQTEYKAELTKLATETYKNSTAGKNAIESIDAQSAAIKRRADVQSILNDREKEYLAFQKRTGEISEETSITKTAALERKALSDQKQAIEDQLGLAKRKLDSQKEQADLAGQIHGINEKITSSEKKEQQDLIELQQKRAQSSKDLALQGILAATAERDSLVTALGAQLDYNQEIGLTKLQVAELREERLLDAAALKDESAAAIEAFEPNSKLAGIYREQAQALRDQAGATIGSAAREASQELKEFLDPARAQTFGEALRTAFGTAGDSLVKLTGALQDFGAKQVEVEKQRGNAAWSYLNGKKTEEAYLSDIDKLNRQGIKNQMAGYGDMASAAAGFFDEHSRGYRTLMAVSQVFHAAELAMTTAELVPKAISAVLTQGQGDPYTAFGRMAAMAAIVAGLGVAIGGAGGGGGQNASQQRQAAQGAGTVLGDSSAKSNSIARAVELSAANSSTQINYLASMNAALQTIQNNIQGFAAQLLRTTDVTNPNVDPLNTNNGLGKSVVAGGLTAIGGIAASGFAAFTSMAAIAGPLGMAAALLVTKIPVLNNLIGKIGTAVFGGKQSVKDSGITINKTDLASILANGVTAQTYADITTSGGWFRSDKNSTKTADLDAEANRQFTAIITAMATTVKQAGLLLGASGDDFTKKLNSFVIDIGKISLKDLKGDDLQKALEAVFSKLGDQMAQYSITGLEQFQKVGEGYLETLVRVASDYAKVDASLQSIGKTFGDVGLKSIAARENLIELVGGIDQFQSKTADFSQNFLTKSQQQAPVLAYVTQQLDSMNLGWVHTREQFASVVTALDLTSAAGQQTYASLMSLEGAFAATHAAIADTGKTIQEIADERKDLQSQYDQLTMSSTQLLAKQRDALDESNRALFDQVQALTEQADAVQAAKDAASGLLGNVDNAFSALQKAVGREKIAVQASIDGHTAAVSKLQSLSQSLHGTLNSMMSPDQQAMARAAAQAQIRAALATAKAGGPLPYADSLKDALSAVSKTSTDQFGSYQDYLRDLYKTQNDIAALGNVTDDQLSVEQKSLVAAQDQLKSLDSILAKYQDQIDVLKGQSTTLLSIDQAAQGVLTAILAAQSNPVVAATSAINSAYQSSLGRAPDAAGLSYWQQQAAAGVSPGDIQHAIATSPEATLQGMYQTMFHRTADADGLQYWLNQLKSGTSWADIGNAFMNSAEAKTLHPFAVGTNFIPDDMPAMVHKGERIIPAADNRQLMARLAAPSRNSDALVAEIKELRKTVEKQQKALDKIAQSTGKHADMFENATAGGGPMLVEIA